MFRKGTRVVVVDEIVAKGLGANVKNGQKGTVGEPASGPDFVRVHIDGDHSPTAWGMPNAAVKRIRK